jgi:hypothetical protein
LEDGHVIKGVVLAAVERQRRSINVYVQAVGMPACAF